jgi:enamine deaminase RidA (YjgF/YER057c/UK114 family)
MPKPIAPREFGPPPGMYSHGMIAAGGQLLVVAGQVAMTRGEVAGAAVDSQTRQRPPARRAPGRRRR